jgi:hypothetical protein
VGRTKKPTNSTNGGKAIIPPRLSAGQAYYGVLLCPAFVLAPIFFLPYTLSIKKVILLSAMIVLSNY